MAISSPLRGQWARSLRQYIVDGPRTSSETGHWAVSGRGHGERVLYFADHGQSIQANQKLPAVTIVIEWENAIDVEDKWTRAAMSALEREIAAVAPRMAAKPRIMYLYDKNAVEPAPSSRRSPRRAAACKDLADLEIMPTDGLTYYKLKNYGISRAKTELSIMLDSDAAPQPGWLESLIKPFADPEMMAVGGFTVLGADDFLSKTFALSWIFDLRSERENTVKREKIHANNCAVRTDFFRDNPFPDLPAFKKQCGFWLRDLSARGTSTRAPPTP